MPQDKSFRNFYKILTLLAIILVLFVNGAIPFLMVPSLTPVTWTTAFSQSMANGALLDFYAHDFGIPKPAAISFGLAGAWPASLLIRLGLHPADAYTWIVAIWLGLAMFSANRIAHRFGATRLIALLGAVMWMTMPIIWKHNGYGMLSIGIALLSFYFFAAFKLFLIESTSVRIDPNSILLYVAAAVVSVFMDGYTFMMFVIGSSILLVYQFLTRSDIRPLLVKIAVPVHVVSFALAYILFSIYIGKSSFDPHHIDFFRGWGLDLSFIAIPTEGALWLPDFLGLSVKRTDEVYFGDESVWATTFALPVLFFGVVAWWRARHRIKISTGILIVSIFCFYMALGPSLKINSMKPDALQQNHPRQLSALMAPEYAVMPTGNAWLFENLPGFNVMRASYRWSALGIFALWVLFIACTSSSNRISRRVWLGILIMLIIINFPDYEKKWYEGSDNRKIFQQIDRDLVAELRKHILPGETVVFLPWNNDFIAGYLAPKVGFRTFNIGGDKNLEIAQQFWPNELHSLGGEFDSSKKMASVKMLIDGTADVVVLPYFGMQWSPHPWPCVEDTIAKLSEKERENFRKIPGFPCPAERRSELHSTVAGLRDLPYLEVVESDMFAVLRLRREFSEKSDRQTLFNGIVSGIKYPILIDLNLESYPYLLQEGWHNLEANQVWSKSAAKLLLPIPEHCDLGKCDAQLTFGVFGAGPERPVEVLFDSSVENWKFVESLTATSGNTNRLSIPIASGPKFLSINISIPNATSPRNLIGSTDDRILGISLQRVELIKR